MNTTETVTGTIASVSAATGATIDVTVNTIGGSGTFRLDLKSSGTGITDDAGNPISGGFTTGQTYTTPDATITYTDGIAFAPSITPNSMNQAIGRFQLTSDISGASLTAVSIKLNGTRTGLTNLILWSSTNATFESSTDVQVGSTIAVDPGDGNSASFSSLSSAISTAGTYYFVTGDIAAGATGTVQGVIVGNSSLTLNYGTLSGTITNAVLSTGTSPLPVELTSFTASPVNNAATLTWQTATEVNNYGFEIERRVVGQTFMSDAVGWSKIGFVAGNCTSNSGHSYSYTDNTASSGTFAYRLKQIDNNGTFKYSQSTELTIAVPKEFTLGQNYPNPFNPSTTIKYDIPSSPFSQKGEQGGFVTLKVYDILGREVATLVNETKEAGSYEVKFNASKLSSGLYLYKLKAGSFTATKKLILLR